MALNYYAYVLCKRLPTLCLHKILILIPFAHCKVFLFYLFFFSLFFSARTKPATNAWPYLEHIPFMTIQDHKERPETIVSVILCVYTHVYTRISVLLKRLCPFTSSECHPRNSQCTAEYGATFVIFIGPYFHFYHAFHLYCLCFLCICSMLSHCKAARPSSIHNNMSFRNNIETLSTL